MSHATKAGNFKFHLNLITLNLNSHPWLAVTTGDTASQVAMTWVWVAVVKEVKCDQSLCTFKKLG